MTDVLKTVTDRFCLYSNARKGRQNGRQYVLSAVKAMLESKETQEGLRLGELFGYYGHGRRQLTGKLEVPETSVIMVEGRPVVIDNVPACRQWLYPLTTTASLPIHRKFLTQSRVKLSPR